MKPSLLIVLLALAGITLFAFLRKEPVNTVEKPPAAEATEVKTPETPEPDDKPDVNTNRLTGPHDGSHLRQGFNCPACAYKPLEY